MPAFKFQVLDPNLNYAVIGAKFPVTVFFELEDVPDDYRLDVSIPVVPYFDGHDAPPLEIPIFLFYAETIESDNSYANINTSIIKIVPFFNATVEQPQVEEETAILSVEIPAIYSLFSTDSEQSIEFNITTSRIKPYFYANIDVVARFDVELPLVLFDSELFHPSRFELSVKLKKIIPTFIVEPGYNIVFDFQTHEVSAYFYGESALEISANFDIGIHANAVFFGGEAGTFPSGDEEIIRYFYYNYAFDILKGEHPDWSDEEIIRYMENTK